jgi:hypothetical protein
VWTSCEETGSSRAVQPGGAASLLTLKTQAGSEPVSTRFACDAGQGDRSLPAFLGSSQKLVTGVFNREPVPGGDVQVRVTLGTTVVDLRARSRSKTSQASSSKRFACGPVTSTGFCRSPSSGP